MTNLATTNFGNLIGTTNDRQHRKPVYDVFVIACKCMLSGVRCLLVLVVLSVETKYENIKLYIANTYCIELESTMVFDLQDCATSIEPKKSSSILTRTRLKL